MPPKKEDLEVPLKVRVPRVLLERVKAYRHSRQFEHQKDAVVDLLSKALDIAENATEIPSDSPAQAAK